MDLSYEAQQLVSSVVRFLIKGFLGLALVTFVIQWILPRFSKWHRLPLPQTAVQRDANDEGGCDQQHEKQTTVRHRLQLQHQNKAESYKERILNPREEARRKQKEEEYYRFLGPAWKGKGQALGEDETLRANGGEEGQVTQEEEDRTPCQEAAQRRWIQKPTPQPLQPAAKPKRVVKLPEEPPEDAADSVLVILRSPIQTCYRRRFCQSDSVQTLLDFMTMSGFSQTFNTLCTSFPRHDIGCNKDARLHELGFKGRVTLNIEEKEL